MEKDEKWTVEADKDCVEVDLPGQADLFVDSLLSLADAADDAGLTKTADAVGALLPKVSLLKFAQYEASQQYLILNGRAFEKAFGEKIKDKKDNTEVSFHKAWFDVLEEYQKSLEGNQGDFLERYAGRKTLPIEKFAQQAFSKRLEFKFAGGEHPGVAMYEATDELLTGRHVASVMKEVVAALGEVSGSSNEKVSKLAKAALKQAGFFGDIGNWVSEKGRGITNYIGAGDTLTLLVRRLNGPLSDAIHQISRNLGLTETGPGSGPGALAPDGTKEPLPPEPKADPNADPRTLQKADEPVVQRGPQTGFGGELPEGTPYPEDAAAQSGPLPPVQRIPAKPGTQAPATPSYEDVRPGPSLVPPWKDRRWLRRPKTTGPVQPRLAPAFNLKDIVTAQAGGIPADEVYRIIGPIETDLHNYLNRLTQLGWTNAGQIKLPPLATIVQNGLISPQALTDYLTKLKSAAPLVTEEIAKQADRVMAKNYPQGMGVQGPTTPGQWGLGNQQQPGQGQVNQTDNREPLPLPETGQAEQSKAGQPERGSQWDPSTTDIAGAGQYIRTFLKKFDTQTPEIKKQQLDALRKVLTDKEKAWAGPVAQVRQPGA